MSADIGQALGWAFYVMRHDDLAIREYRKAVELSGRVPWALSLLGYAYASAARRPEARAILRQLDGMSEHCSVCALARAVTWANLWARNSKLSRGWRKPIRRTTSA